MRFKKEFIEREIVGETVLIPTGETAAHFNGLISVNELGRFIWDNYENAKDEDDLLQKILDEYEFAPARGSPLLVDITISVSS